MLLDGAFPLHQDRQLVHRIHQSPGVVVHHLTGILIWVHIGSSLPIHLLDCLQKNLQLTEEVMRQTGGSPELVTAMSVGCAKHMPIAAC